MSLPYFYIESYDATSSLITLNEETSKHVVQVLRMKNGEQLNLTDGKGTLLTAQITDAHKKNCEVNVIASTATVKSERNISIAISLVKNASRFEWFLEKATEIGVTEIVPLICERTERQHFRHERLKGIIVSAMLQSRQVWLPVLREPVKFNDYVAENSRQTGSSDGALKLIAHCEDGNKQSIADIQIHQSSTAVIFIGPEGDFSSNEIELALQHHCKPVTLGETRLRTETAGVVAAVLLCF